MLFGASSISTKKNFLRCATQEQGLVIIGKKIELVAY